MRGGEGSVVNTGRWDGDGKRAGARRKEGEAYFGGFVYLVSIGTGIVVVVHIQVLFVFVFLCLFLVVLGSVSQ